MAKDPAEIKKHISILEKKLWDAFAAKHLEVIAELLHNDALFVYPNGQVLTKAMVLDNYHNDNSAFTKLLASEEEISLVGDSAVVTLRLELNGKYFEEEINAQFRYLRVWKLTNSAWQVIAVSGVSLPKDK